jgi:hypothetical protein
VPRTTLSLAALGTVAVASACAIPADPPPDRRSKPSLDPGLGHVHGVDLNPADGLVYAATHFGVFRLRPDGPERIADRHQDTMGFTIAGPDLFLGSGHPDPREAGPPHLGLVSSTDRAQTWAPVALVGEADFHALSVAGATVYGLDVIDGVLMTTGRTGSAAPSLATPLTSTSTPTIRCTFWPRRNAGCWRATTAG